MRKIIEKFSVTAFTVITLLLASCAMPTTEVDSSAKNNPNTISFDQKAPSRVSSDRWSLVWSDEFNYTGLPDSSKWGYDVGGGGWGNNELQYYTQNRLANAKVENGKLIITAIKENYGGREFTSTRLISKNKGDWLYGKVEVKAKLPRGRGTWPAIWMLPTDWAYGGWPDSGEIDIMEHVGYDQGRVHGTVHTKAFNHTQGTHVGNSTFSSTVSDTFHTYTIEWYPEKIDFFMDGKKYFTFNNQYKTFAEWPFDKRFHLIMNIAVGGNWGGAQGVDYTIWPQRLEVDYVRVYKQGSSPDLPVTVYEHSNYGGWKATMDVGSYTLSQLVSKGFVNDRMTSYKVRSGYKAILYWDDHFGGATYEITGEGNLPAQWNDKVSSIKVEKKSNGGGTTLHFEAENYAYMSGVQTEACSEGGLNVAYIDANDWIAFTGMNISQSGSYRVEYRVASQSTGGTIRFEQNAGNTHLGTINVPVTGGWQNWTTISHNITLNAGVQDFGLNFPAGGFNLNWIKIIKN